MRTQHFVHSRVLVLLLPLMLGLACGLKRDWSICAPADKQPCLPGYVCTPDLHCVRAGDGGIDGLVSVDGQGPTDAAVGGMDGPMSSGTDGPGAGPDGPTSGKTDGAGSPTTAPDAADSPGPALPDAPAGADGPGSPTTAPDAVDSPGPALPDAPATPSPGLDGSAGSGGSSGGTDAPADVPMAPADVPSLLAPGAPCLAGSDCAAGSCAYNAAGLSKICCSSACSNACQACKSDGSGCTQKNSGLADSACGTTPASCQDGTCDGVSGCKIATGATCGSALCAAGSLTLAPTCSSSGQCVAPLPTRCPSGICSSSTACAASVCNNGVVEAGETCDPISACTAASQACVSDASYVRTRTGDPSACTFVCQQSARGCGAADSYCPPGCTNPSDPDCPKSNGQSCTSPSECSSGFCASGVCCNRACTEACEQCTAAAGGQCANKTGTQCLAATSCTNAAVCSGSSGTCPTPTPKPAGTTCGTVTCTGSTQSGPTCDGAGSCGASTNKECYPYACVQGSGCKSSCATNADCVAGNSIFCGKNGTCILDGKCWHAADSSTPPLWQVNPKEIADPDLGPYNPQNHHYNAPGSTPDDVCGALTLCGFDDWAVPTIDELRSLIRGCPSTVTGGTCGVTNACLGTACDTGCGICDYLAGPGSGQCYWPVGLNGPCSGYWSSSIYYNSDPDYMSYRYRFVGFTDGSVNSCDPSDGNYVRCVRRWQ